MKEYVIDARLLHSWTLKYLSEGSFTKLICVSEKTESDDLRRLQLNNLPQLVVDCVFYLPDELKVDETENTLIVFESFRNLMQCRCEDIKEILVIYVSAWGQPAKCYEEGLYLTMEDEKIVTDLINDNIKLYYQPKTSITKRLLSEILAGYDAG